MKTFLKACVLLGLVGSLSTSAFAAVTSTLTVEIDALIDGRDQLIIGPGTLQWEHFDKAVVGRHSQPEGTGLPTYLTVTLGSSVLHNNDAWTPDWPSSVPYPPNDWYLRDINAFSSILTDPALGDWKATSASVTSTGRQPVSIIQNPTAANGYTTIVEFNDNPIGSSAWYNAIIEMEVVNNRLNDDNATVPVPGAFLLGTAGLSCIRLFRKRYFG